MKPPFPLFDQSGDPLPKRLQPQLDVVLSLCGGIRTSDGTIGGVEERIRQELTSALVRLDRKGEGLADGITSLLDELGEGPAKMLLSERLGLPSLHVPPTGMDDTLMTVGAPVGGVPDDEILGLPFGLSPNLEPLQAFLASGHCHTREVFVLEGPDGSNKNAIARQALEEWAPALGDLSGIFVDMEASGPSILAALESDDREYFRHSMFLDAPMLALGNLDRLPPTDGCVREISCILADRYDRYLPTLITLAEWGSPFMVRLQEVDPSVHTRLFRASRMRLE